MLFTSFEFLLFIATVFVAYYIFPKKYQWCVLLAASFGFYSLYGWDCVAFILCTILTSYLTACRLTKLRLKQEAYIKEQKGILSRDELKAYKAQMKKKQWRWLLLCLLLNLGILAVLKYTNFAIYNVNAVFRAFHVNRQLGAVNFLLPMGISFYTFQTVGYLIDVYNGKYPAEKNVAKLALFISFFPQLVQGPISRFDELQKTLFAPHKAEWQQISFGLQRILWGFFKKLVIAERLLTVFHTLTGDPEKYNGAFAIPVMLSYALALYMDFSSGIDITIGVAEVMGIRIAENFNRPYFSKSISEFWRRWHITLGAWFREYMFYPLSVCKPIGKLTKKTKKWFGNAVGKRIPVYLSSLLVWFTTGIWHGASWNFIMWGILNSVVILISQELEPLYEKFHNRFPSLNNGHFGYRLFSVLRTFALMCSLHITECYASLSTAAWVYASLFWKGNFGELFQGSLMQLGLDGKDYIIVFAGLLLVLVVSLLQRSGSVRKKVAAKPVYIRFAVWYLLFAAVLVFGAYGIGYDASQFIYNQF